MHVPFSWLQEHLPVDDVNHIADLLTSVGLEVEAIAHTFPAQGVVVGEVMHVENSVVSIYDGEQKLQVFTTAAYSVGDLVPFARIGAQMPDGKIIHKARRGGIDSCGMLCSYDELEMEPVELQAAPGTPLDQLYGEAVLRIALTPNLGHCASIHGIARELSPLIEKPLTEISSPILCPRGEQTHVVDGCSRYTYCLMEGIAIAPSPHYVQRRLEMCGMHPVNNVVDITNYIMLAWGQPLHAFDKERMHGLPIVREACQGEHMTLLNGERVTLQGGELLVTDREGPLALAGIMGGAASEVQATTTNLLIEAAQFDSRSIRCTSKQLGIQTEASYRFERGVDPLLPPLALAHAVQMLVQHAGGKCSGYADHAQPFAPMQLSCRMRTIHRVLGLPISSEEACSLLAKAGLSAQGNDTLHVTVPTYRHDLTAEIDLVEEVTRLHGYTSLLSLPSPPFRMGTFPHDPLYLLERRVRMALVAEGLQEMATCSLISASEAKFYDHTVTLVNPRLVDRSTLRPSLLPGLISAVIHNSDQMIRSVAAFEVGRVYHYETRYAESLMAAMILTGTTPEHWSSPSQEVDFFDIKGLVEGLFHRLRVSSIMRGGEDSRFHPGRQAEIFVDGNSVGIVGQLHPTIWKRPLYYAEVALEQLHGERERLYCPLPTFPASTRDWTIATKMPAGKLLTWAREVNEPHLEQVVLTAVYETPDSRNITLRFTYRDRAGTLAAPVVEETHGRIINYLFDKLNEGDTL